jgi:hypothetical protein
VRRRLDLDVQHWLDAYMPRLVELPAPSDPIGADWKVALGNAKRISDWIALFAAQLDEDSWRDVLAVWWPRLLPGIVAGSTHGVIRVGHAVRTLLAADESVAALTELAHGLAFWAGRSRPVPGLGTPSGALDAAAALDAVPHLPEQKGVIASRIPRLAGVPGWPESVAALNGPADDDDVPARLAELVDAATLRYLLESRPDGCRPRYRRASTSAADTMRRSRSPSSPGPVAPRPCGRPRPHHDGTQQGRFRHDRHPSSEDASSQVRSQPNRGHPLSSRASDRP